MTDEGLPADRLNRILTAVEHLYGLDIDTNALEQFASEIEQYYRDLEDRLETVSQVEVPEDRMFM
jgi:predicted ATP-grasp superfamily ATP-dependent carboligase